MRILLLALPLLAACAAPSTCPEPVSPAARELARVEALLARSERALALGYRSERTAAVRPGIGFCAGIGRSRGRLVLCDDDRIVTGVRRTAIDPLAERRILTNLRTRAEALRREAARRAAACAP